MFVQSRRYLYFAALLPAGFFLGLLLCLRFGIRIDPAFPEPGQTGFLSVTLAWYYAMMRIPLLIFFSGFTVFAPFVSSVSMLYLGTVLGGKVCAAGASGIGAGRIPSLLLLAFLLTLTVLIGGQASAHRDLLRSAAPRASVLAHSRESRGYIACFMTVAALFLAAALAAARFPELIFLF